MPLQATSGAASYDAFGGGVAAVPTFVEDVFSCFLYTGTSASQTITNGIDLSGKGGMTWFKTRSAVSSVLVFDTVRGYTNTNAPYLATNLTNAEVAGSNIVNATSTGFDITVAGGASINQSGTTYVSWTFRKQPKFFDVVTWSGNSVSGRQISHALGSTPGCIIVKCTSTSGDDWCVFHRSLGRSSAIFLNLTSASGSSALWDGTDPTSTNFTVSSNGSVNGTGNTYVAYLFAHNAGGFGLTGTDNVISCGSFTTDGGGAYSVTLGYEPQLVLMKRTDSTGDWLLMDNMRGMPVGGNDAILRPNTSGAETQTFDCANPTATGFYESTGSLGASRTFIYIAIRRGPMKVPTSGTSVFAPDASTGTGSTRTITTNFPVDFQLANSRTGGSWPVRDRLRGGGVGTTKQLTTTTTAAETTTSSSFGISFDNNTGIGLYQTTSNLSGTNYIYYHFRRAPSFFDEVCYTGDGTDPRNITHNLTVSPELVIIKARSRIDDWVVRSSAFPAGVNGIAYLNLTDAATNGGYSYVPTTTTFQIGGNFNQNQSGQTYVAYLFATCAGVSKVGSYTGNGSSQTINCGFTAGARFVLIKATSTTGDWMVSDSARGIVSGNDPYLELNNTNAEVTGEDWLDTDSTGFVVNEVSGSNANTNGATYIFLAIA